MYAGIELDYYKAQNFTVFFQPIDLDMNTDEYVASIHITHEATIPDASSIEYGYTQFNSTDIEDYSGVTRPLITPDRHTILLTRYNELFLTQDFLTYTAINGKWPDNVDIEVYRVNDDIPNGELVDASLYASNNKEGTIIFVNAQSETDQFVLTVALSPCFRFLCKVINYGTEGATIDHIGLIYNITKRIPVDLAGNIIHNSISRRMG